MWRGRLSPRRALELIGGLDYVPYSRYRVIKYDEPLLLGWDAPSRLLADVNDTLMAALLGFAGKPLREADMTPRPRLGEVADDKAHPPTIAEFDEHWFMAQL